jgi:hypothetical protein
LENSCASSVGVCAVGYCCIDGLYSGYWCQEQSKYFVGDIFIKPTRTIPDSFVVKIQYGTVDFNYWRSRRDTLEYFLGLSWLEGNICANVTSICRHGSGSSVQTKSVVRRWMIIAIYRNVCRWQPRFHAPIHSLFATSLAIGYIKLLDHCLLPRIGNSNDVSAWRCTALHAGDDCSHQTLSFLDTIEFVVRQCLSGFQVAASSKMGADNIESSVPSARQSLSRSVTVSLPPVIALMLW